MAIAHFVHRYPPALGGAESYVARLSQYLHDQGDAVTVWTSTALDLSAMTGPGRHLPESTQDTDSVRRFRPLNFPGRRYLFKALSLIPIPSWQTLVMPANPICPGMWRAVGQHQQPVEAVHTFAFPHSFPARCGLQLALKRNVPFFVTPFLHLGDPAQPRNRTRRQYTRRPLRWLLQQADRVFVQTPSEQAALAELGIPEERIVLQGLGVDLVECTGGGRERVRAEWSVTPDTLVIGHLGNLSEEKGSVDLLRWLRSHPEVNVRLVLAGPAMPNFEREWILMAGDRRLIRLGVLSEAQRRDFYAGIDAFAFPSRTDSFGLVLLEAWANRKPVVVYQAGGPADLVRDGVDGFVVPCGDLDGMSQAIGRWVEHRGGIKEQGEAGYARLARDFDWNEKLGLVRRTIHERIAAWKEGARTVVAARVPGITAPSAPRTPIHQTDGAVAREPLAPHSPSPERRSTPRR